MVIILGGMVIYSIYYVSVISNIQEMGKLKSTWSNKEANTAATFNRKHDTFYYWYSVRDSVRLPHNSGHVYVDYIYRRK